jgi:hypothetical protein
VVGSIVIRYNYQPSAFEQFAAHVPATTIDPALRRTLVRAGAILGALGILTAIELGRLATAEKDLDALRARAAASAPAAAAAARLTSDVEQLRATAAAIDRSRRDGLLRADDLVRVGNLLPEQTWLTAIHEDRSGTWSIEGRSTRLVEIGATLGALQRLDPRAGVHLVSVLGIGRGRALEFTLTWARRT